MARGKNGKYCILLTNLCYSMCIPCLAETMGLKARIPISTIASWEHKNPAVAKIPTHDKIEALSNLFDVSVDYLKGLSEDPNPGELMHTHILSR